MNYYKKINESFKKTNVFSTSDKLLKEEEHKDNNFFTQTTKENTQKELLELIAGKMSRGIIHDNAIYQIEEEISAGNKNFDVGIFSIYEFVDENNEFIVSHNVKPEVVGEIDKIGKKPLSYFSEGVDWKFNSVIGFLEWFDRFFGRDTFNLKNSNNADLRDYINYLFNLNESKMFKEIEYIVKTEEGYIATKEFKDFFISFLENENPSKHEIEFFSNSFYDFGSYELEDVEKLKDNINKKWEFVPGGGNVPTEEKQYLDSYYGLDFSMGFYINDKYFDSVSFEFVRRFVEEKNEEEQVNEEKESDVFKNYNIEEVIKNLKDNETIYSQLGDTLFTDYIDIFTTPGHTFYIEGEAMIKSLYYLLTEGEESLYDIVYGSPEAKKFLEDTMLKVFRERVVKDGEKGFIFEMSSKDIKNKSKIHISDEFLNDLFKRDIYHYFNDIVGNTSNFALPLINDENMKKFNNFGITKDFIEACLRDMVEESDPYFNYCSSIKKIISQSISTGFEIGSVNYALKAFESSFNDALPEGVFYEPSDTFEQDTRNILITEKYVLKNLIKLFAETAYGGYTDDAKNFKEALGDTFLVDFNNKFILTIPTYGFQDFSEGAFNEALSDRIEELADL
jgi:hypothetical protein